MESSALISSSNSSKSPRAPGAAAAVEALALLKVVAAQLQGPSGAALRAAIASQAVSDDDVGKVAGLAQVLAGLVEPSPSPAPPLQPPVLERRGTSQGSSLGSLSSTTSSSSGLTTLASADSLLSSSLSEVCAWKACRCLLAPVRPAVSPLTPTDTSNPPYPTIMIKEHR